MTFSRRGLSRRVTPSGLRYSVTCEHCDERLTEAGTAGGALFNRDTHIANCEQAPKRQQRAASGRVHWIGQR